VIVAAGFFVWLVGWGAHQSFGIFFKPLMDEFGWTRAETVLAYSLVLIVQAFAGIAMGWLTDRLGPKIVVAGFGSLFGIAYLLMSQMNSLWQFYTYYALFTAVGISTASIPMMATVARWFTRKRGLMLAIVQAGTGVGGFVFAPFASWLITNYDWRTAYKVIGIIALVVIVLCGLLLKRAPGSQDHLQERVSQAGPSPNKKPETVSVKGATLREALHSRQFWIICGIFFSFGFSRSTFLPHVAPHVQDLGFSLADGANVVGALTVSSILGRLWLGWLSNKWAFIISFAVTTVALGWALVTGDLWGLYLFAIVFGFGWGAQAVLRFTVSSEAFGLNSIGLIMGVLGFSEAIAAAVGSFLAGYIFDVTGNYQPVFWIGIPVSLAGVILTAVLPIGKKMKVDGGLH
jgi:MFS family permease